MPVIQKAFILIKVGPCHEEDVIDDLMKIPEIQEAHIVPGLWDILAVMSTPKDIVLTSDEKVYRLVLQRVEKIKHVRDTNTMVAQFSRTK